MTTAVRLVLNALLVVVIAGCGGGGGGSTPPPPAAPVIGFGNTTNYTLTTGVAISITPTNTGGAADSWAVAPALPAGLTFNTSTGAIAGTITDSMAPTVFTITATNAGGSASATLTVGAQSVLLNLGSGFLGAVALSSTRVLTEQGGGNEHWVLWDYATGALIAQGDSCPPGKCSFSDVGALEQVQLAGQIAVVPYTAGALQILSATDGSVMATVNSTGPWWWQVASDGSYVCGGNTTALTVWAPDGSVIATHPGDYQRAIASCAPGQVRIAMGPAGSNVIETLTVPDGSDSVSPAFAGTFGSWFLDGSAFLTSTGNTMWVYSPTAVQLDTQILPTTQSLGGEGTWFWTFDGSTLNIYKVGSSNAPTASYTGVFAPLQASGPTIAIMDNKVHIIDLSGAAPTETDYAPPIGGNVYAAVSATQWVLADSNGALIDGASVGSTPRYFGYGQVLGIAASNVNFAVATGIGKILIFDAGTLELTGTLDYLAKKIQLSADGTTLAMLAAQSTSPSVAPDGSVRTISLPSGTVLNTWPYTLNYPFATDISLSSSGALLGQVLAVSNFGDLMRQVTTSGGGPVLWSDTGSAQPIRLSADDTLIAASTAMDSTASTPIYLHDVQSSAVPGWSTGWLPNNSILQLTNSTGSPWGLYDSSGIKLSAPPLPSSLGGQFQFLSADSLYDPGSNAIYMLSTGAKTWSASGSYGQGAVAGPVVVFVGANQVFTEPH